MICQRCILPDNYDGIHFDENGVCNICNYYDKKWGQKDETKSKAELDRIIEHYRARHGRYDCIVPLSGAKDSTYVLYYLKKEYNLNMLAVNFKMGFQTEQTIENMENACKILDVDFVSFLPRWGVLKNAYATCFKKAGEFCLPCNVGTAATVYHAAEDYQTPLIVWGYTAQVEISPIWRGIHFCREKLFKKILQDEISDEELEWFFIDPIKRRIPLHPISLFSYIKWDPDIIFKTLKSELKWREGPYGWDKVDCNVFPVAKYLRKKRSGFSRATITNAAAVRVGLLSREEALQKVKDEEIIEEPPIMDEWLEKLDLTREDIVDFEKRNRLDFVERVVSDEAYQSLEGLKGKYKPEEIIERVFETIRPELHRDGGDVELNRIEDGIIYVNWKGDCKYCWVKDTVMVNWLESIILPIIPDIRSVESVDEFIG